MNVTDYEKLTDEELSDALTEELARYREAERQCAPGHGVWWPVAPACDEYKRRHTKVCTGRRRKS